MQKWLLAGVFLGVIWLAGGCLIQPIQPTGATTLPIKGAAGLGDKLFPNAGNGGYDVQQYDLDLTVDVASNTITGTATLTALATATLDTFNLDFHALTIDELTVNGVETPYQRQEDELVIDPLLPVGGNAIFTVTVQYHGRPKPLLFDFYNTGWLNFTDSIGVGNEPNGAATWYPVNDHPLDRATYRLRVTVPMPYVVAANGRLQKTIPATDGWNTYVWVMDKPMASYLAAVAIDKFTLQSEPVADDVVLRNYIAPNISERSLALLEPTAAMLAMLNEAVGPYPYAEYGVVLHNHSPYAMETQTLSQLSQQALRDYGEEVVVHELAHQWFGNSIGLAQWQDVWLKEGFVTYAEWLWIEKRQGAAAMRRRIEQIYAHTPGLDLPPATPTVETLYDNSVYYRGALTLYALRLHLGDERFFQLLHSYYERYRGGYATTADFIALAEEVSGEDLTAFFQAWLYDDKLPPLPSIE
ncbi:MAG: M1 family metallopeptidase [Caldilineaceae bacterium]